MALHPLLLPLLLFGALLPAVVAQEQAPTSALSADHADPASIRAVISDAMPGWVAAAGAYTCSTIGGGVTNHLFRCVAEPASGSEDRPELLFRIYGAGTEMMIDRALETKTLVDLSARGSPTGLHATFANGRIERFLRGRVITLDEMRDKKMRRRIAEGLAHLHRLDMPGDPQPSLWGSLEKVLGIVESKKMRIPGDHKLSEIRKGIRRLRSAADQTNSTVLFTHNDAQALNMIYEVNKLPLFLPHFNPFLLHVYRF